MPSLKTWDGTQWVDIQSVADLTTAQADSRYASKTEIQSVQQTLDDQNTRIGAMHPVPDGVGEWWIYPTAMYQREPYSRTVFGALSSTAKVLACEFNHGTGQIRRYEVGTAANDDDHNVPAIWVKEGRRTIITWNHHSEHTFLSFKVGSISGDLASLVSTKEQRIDFGSGASYTQLHHIRHLSDETQDTFWLFSRATGGWFITSLSISQESGVITSGPPLHFQNGGQSYMITAPGNEDDEVDQTIRFAIGMNPNDDSHEIYVGIINCVTGSITSENDSDFSANMNGSGLPITQANVDPMIPHASVDSSRRLFYVRPGPDTIAVSYADWDTSNPDAAVYKVGEWDLGENHLRTGSGGGAQTEYNTAYGDPNGFTYTVALKLPDSLPASTFSVGRISDGYASNNGWILDINSSGNIRLYMQTSSGLINHAIATPILDWGNPIGLRVLVDMIGGVMRRYISRNPFDNDPLWEELGSGTGVSVSGTVTYAANAPLLVPANNVCPEVYYWELRNSENNVVAGVNVTNEWTPNTASYVDSLGRTWTLLSGATISENIPFLKETSYGESGTRVGYTATANYIAGVAFENPSRDEVLIRARTDGSNEFVERILGDVVEVIKTQPTSQGRLVRPYTPVGGGPLRTLITNMTQYPPDNYNDYYGDIIGIN